MRSRNSGRPDPVRDRRSTGASRCRRRAIQLPEPSCRSRLHRRLGSGSPEQLSRPAAAEHLRVFLGRDAQVLDRDVDPDRIAPEVILKAGRLVLGIQHELGDAPAERAHHLEPRRAEVAQVGARDVERLRVRQAAGREVGLQQVERRGFDGGVRRRWGSPASSARGARARTGPPDRGSRVVLSVGLASHARRPHAVVMAAAVVHAQLVTGQHFIGRVVDDTVCGRRRRRAHRLEALVDDVDQRQRGAFVGARDVQRSERTAPAAQHVAERAVPGAGAANGSSQVDALGELQQLVKVFDRTERRQVARRDAVGERARVHRLKRAARPRRWSCRGEPSVSALA